MPECRRLPESSTRVKKEQVNYIALPDYKRSETTDPPDMTKEENIECNPWISELLILTEPVTFIYIQQIMVDMY